MMTVSLRELDGFPKPYLESLIGEDTSPAAMATSREAILAKAREVSRLIDPDLCLADAIEHGTPWYSRSAAWMQRVEILNRERASLIVAMPRIGRSGGSMAQLLKCMTAAQLVRELELGGSPAIPLCWPIACDAEPVRLAGEGRGRPEASGIDERNLIRRFKNILESALEVDDTGEVPALSDPVNLRCLALGFWAWLGRDLGWLVADFESTLVGPALGGGKPDAGEYRVHMSGSAIAGDTRRDAETGRDSIALMMEVAPLLPIAGLVVGPDDHQEADRIADRMELAGCAKPFLFPRLSATVLDRRCCRIMRKYGFRLTDLLVQGKPQPGGSGNDKDPSAIVRGLDATARSVESAVDELARDAAGRPRLSRRVRAGGDRIIFQMRKIESRVRLAFEQRKTVLSRQAGQLKAKVAPDGNLQENSFSVVDFLEWLSPAALSLLYERSDIWNRQHQLICLDGTS